MSLLPDYTEIDRLRAEVSRLTAEDSAELSQALDVIAKHGDEVERLTAELAAETEIRQSNLRRIDCLEKELAKAELQRDTYRDAWQTVAAEIAELRAQEPVAEVTDVGRVRWLLPAGHCVGLGDKLYSRQVPAAQAPAVAIAANKALSAWMGTGKNMMLAEIMQNGDALASALRTLLADHVRGATEMIDDRVPDAGKTIGETLPPESHWCVAGVEPCPCAVATLKDAARYQWLRNNRMEAQAMFWNYESRKQRDAAIDAAIQKGGA